METYLTADHHFFHSNIIKFYRDEFKDIKAMNNELVRLWNGCVKQEDHIYHLGDFCLCSPRRGMEILSQLNGKKHFCIGSHDKFLKWLRNKPEIMKALDVVQIKTTIFLNEYNMFLAHHPHKSWPKSHYGSFHCHGHSHGGLDEYNKKEGKLLDVGCDSSGYVPWHIDVVKEVMDKRPDNFNLVKDRG